jgi:hypothetical protein
MAIHMGSAKYFHPSEIETTQISPDVKKMAGDLNQNYIAHLRFSIKLSAFNTLDTNAEFAGCESGFTSNLEVLA